MSEPTKTLTDFWWAKEIVRIANLIGDEENAVRSLTDDELVKFIHALDKIIDIVFVTLDDRGMST